MPHLNQLTEGADGNGSNLFYREFSLHLIPIDDFKLLMGVGKSYNVSYLNILSEMCCSLLLLKTRACSSQEFKVSASRLGIIESNTSILSICFTGITETKYVNLYWEWHFVQFDLSF